ncbi:hypothetical protein GCT13_13215 [Paraburkholderia sp. CNPSo 3157]|uniref:Uncharacterized protein n=1 Tax=Paraburkholderia franconis TaxID=2654983 RepID=A0A7X1N9S5_9BURK|nr:hypothetical protein [Paraburkholderia franconis]
MTYIPGTNSFPVCTVSVWFPLPIVSDVVEVALVPGALSAVDALAAAFVALVAALLAFVVVLAMTLFTMLMMFVNIGSSRVRNPPFARPVAGLLSSVTVEPSPPTLVGKFTEFVIRTFPQFQTRCC